MVIHLTTVHTRCCGWLSQNKWLVELAWRTQASDKTANLFWQTLCG
jgi:hypothetical protein